MQRLPVLLFGLVLLLGCSQPKTDEFTEDENIATPPPPTISVMLVDSPGIGGALKRHWSARRNGELDITEINSSEFAENQFQLATNPDVIIYPSGMVGDLVAQNHLLEIPNSTWNSENFNRREILQRSRINLVQFGSKVWGTPVGSPNFVLMVRADVLSAIQCEVPKTWDEFFDAARQLSEAAELKNEQGEALPTAVDLPLAEDWEAQTMLAVAASRVRVRGKLTTVFDMDNLEPLIAQTPFVEALEQIKSVAATERLDPAAVYSRMINGSSAMAIGWPAKAFGQDLSEPNLNVEIHAMPGSEKWYNFSSQEWVERSGDDAINVDLLGFAAKTASVTAQSDEPLTAFEFAEWVSSKQISLLIFPNSQSGAPFRASHLGNVGAWSGDLLSPDAMDGYENQLKKSDQAASFFLFPRVIQQQQYISALNEAVKNTLDKEIPAAKALESAANRWREITESVGVKKQKAWLRKSEGL